MVTLSLRTASRRLLLTIHAALIGIIFSLMVMAFPFGAYVVFNTDLGSNITHEFPINDYFFIAGLPVNLPFTLQLGEYFVLLWCIYLFLFALLMFGPKRNILQALVSMVERGEESGGNSLKMVILWLAVLFVISKALELVQQSFGVSTGAIQYPNHLLQFFNVTASPLREELGFRVLLIGIPAYFIFMGRRSLSGFFKSLWNPGKHLGLQNRRQIYALIAIAAVFFGLAHLFFGGGWSYGKITQASIAGWILGWLYYRYGLQASIILHWSTNYFLFSYGYFGNAIWGFPWNETSGNPFLGAIDTILTVTGIIAMAIFLRDKFRSHLASAKQNSFKDSGVI